MGVNKRPTTKYKQINTQTNLAVSDVGEQPGDSPEDPPEPGDADGLLGGEAGVGGERAEQVLLDLAGGHEVVVARRAHDLLVAEVRAPPPLPQRARQPQPHVRTQAVRNTRQHQRPATKEGWLIASASPVKAKYF